MSSLGRHPERGDKLGRYTLDSPLGAGGMASVFRAIDPHGDAYAIKILNPSRVLPEDVKRFQREFRALSKMSHPNIVRVYESGIYKGYPWIAMELVSGGDLEGLIERWKTHPPADRFARVEELLTHLCKALQYVHNLRLIHRDIKPSNILLTADGIPKVSDFGVVKGGADGTTHVTQLTMAGRLVGTVAFMAPELITSDDDVDHRADLYSLGAVLYLLLCLRRPIEARSIAGYLARHLTEVPVPPGQIDPDVPRNLERVTIRLLQKDRDHRYASASAVLAALDEEAKVERPSLQGRERQLQGWSRRMNALMEGAGGCVVLNGPVGTGKSHLMTVLVESTATTSIRVLSVEDWEDDPIEALANDLGLTSYGSIAALTKAVVATLGQEPAVLAIDDLDRAPRRTINALARVLRQACNEGQPLLLLASACSLDAISDFVTGAATGMPADLIPVGPVEAQAAISMMRDRGILGTPGSLLGRRLHQLYGGLPGPMIDQLNTLLREGWFTGPSENRQLSRSMSDLRQGEFPVPERLEKAVIERLERVRTSERTLLDLLAVIDRPAGAALITRCNGIPSSAARTLDELVGERWLDVVVDDTNERFKFRDPIAARVLRRSMTSDLLCELHGTIAQALGGRRRRAASLELAHHLNASGDPTQAYPIFVNAAKRTARSGSPAEILDICTSAEAIREFVEDNLPDDDALKLREELKTVEGNARLARQDWAGALKALRIALSAARSRDSQKIGSLMGALGRTWSRLGDRRRAQSSLQEALETLSPEEAEWPASTRSLADLHLRAGDFGDADTLWTQALDHSVEQGDRDAEARARRGLAHTRVFQGQLLEASRLLGEADDLLSLDGDADVRAAVLSRAIGIANLTGHWGSAVRRAEQLVDVARRRELSGRLPDAYSLLAIALLAIGAREEALDAASQARVFAIAHPTRQEARLRTARALIDLGRLEDATDVMPDSNHLHPVGVDDQPALHTALRARLLAIESPQEAKDLAIWSLRRPAPLLPFRAAIVALDASKALLVAGDATMARTAAKRGLKVLKGLGADGLRLETLIALQLAGPDPRVLAAMAQVAQRICARLTGPALARFRERPSVKPLLR